MRCLRTDHERDDQARDPLLEAQGLVLVPSPRAPLARRQNVPSNQAQVARRVALSLCMLGALRLLLIGDAKVRA